MKNFFTPFLVLITLQSPAQTVGWFYAEEGHQDGYVLFAPTNSDTTYLIDKCGKRIHTWNSNYEAGLAVHLLDDGTILRCGDTDNGNFGAGGSGGVVEKIAWDGTLLWSYLISNADQCQHHDAIQLPNGNVIAIVWDSYTKTEAVDNGRNPGNIGSEVWSDKLIEIQPVGIDSGIIVWEWNAWDHLVQDYDATKANYGVVADHPELIDLNLGILSAFTADWLHCNGIDYNEDLDQIIISSHHMNELWIIDHSTTTAEAASHSGGNSGKGGDILYRWGNPQNYDRGTSSDQKFYNQHNPQWIPQGLPHAGDIIIFNNGVGRPGTDYSTVETFTPPPVVDWNYPITDTTAYEPLAQNWIYEADPVTSFFTFSMGGVQRLPNGNTIICESNSGTFFEVDSNGLELWKYINPVDASGIVEQGSNPIMNSSFRSVYISPTHPGLQGYSLIPGAPIEENPLNYTCESNLPVGLVDATPADQSISVYPTIFTNSFTVNTQSEVNDLVLEVYDMTGRLLLSNSGFSLTAGGSASVSISDYRGVLFFSIRNSAGSYLFRSTLISQ